MREEGGVEVGVGFDEAGERDEEGVEESGWRRRRWEGERARREELED